MSTFVSAGAGRPRLPAVECPNTTRPCLASRNVTMHITIDAQHARPLRQALVRDCAGQPWSICIAVMPGGARMRVSLTLPRLSVGDALAQLNRLTPGAEVSQYVEVPERPSGAWIDMIHGTQARPGPRVSASHASTIGSILCEEDVVLDCEAADRSALFHHLGTLARQHHGFDAEAVTAGLMEREALGSTGLGQGVAVPHARIRRVPRELAFYVRCVTPLPFDAPDGLPVSDLICLLLPDWGNNAHLRFLASAAQFFCDQRFRSALRHCRDARSVCRLFSGDPASDSAVRR